MPVYENERGTYIFNSKDLCMIEHMPELVQAGMDSFKIEGRMKTALYVATGSQNLSVKALYDYMESEELYKKQDVHGIKKKSQSVPTDSLPPAFSLANQLMKHRFMTATPIAKNTIIWD